MVPVCKGRTDDARWDTSISIPITDCQKLGTYNRNKKRVGRVSFLFMKHKICLLSRKDNILKGIYIDEAYPDMIKQKCAALQPILNLALNTECYKGKCKLEYDQLIIKGTKYSIDSLDKLPDNLAPYKAGQRSNEDCLIFHGQHMPLSNFHSCPFIIEGQKFTSSEQYIQYKKACHFHDHTTAGKIKQSKHPTEAKTLSHNIPNYDRDAWRVVTKDACTPGIRAKFEQNPLLLQFLCATKPLKLAESTLDKLWGTGLSLNDPNALKPSRWINQGLLGKILTEI